MRKLIYFTLNNDKGYIKLARLCIDSLYASGYDQDILFITNLKNAIYKEIKFKSPVHFLDVDDSDLLFSSANKLRIFEWDKCNLYSDILFCDIDMLWMKSPDGLFELLESDKVCFSTDIGKTSEMHITGGDGTMGALFHGGEGLFDKDELEEINRHNLIGVNGGLFGFKPSLVFHFKAMYDFLIKNIDRLGPCLEQPCLNVYCYRHNLISRSLTPLVSQFGNKEDHAYFKDKDFSLIHFQGGPGNFKEKHQTMSAFYDRFIKSK